MRLFFLIVLAVCVVVGLNKLKRSALGPGTEEIRAEIANLQRELDFKQSVVTELRAQYSKLPAVGTVISRSACGGVSRVTDNGASGLLAEISRLEGEVRTLSDRKLEYQRKLAKSTASR